MRELTSSVIIIGDRPPLGSQIQSDYLFRLSEFGFSLSAEKKPSIQVITLPLLVALSDEAEKYFHLLYHLNPHLQLIIHAPKNSNPEDLRTLLNRRKIFHVLSDLNPDKYDKAILSALETEKQRTQDSQLEKMINENNEQLRSLYDELEQKVEKRQESLLEAKNRAFHASARYQILLNLSELLQKANSSSEIENTMTEVLKEPFHIQQAKIALAPQDTIYEQQISSQKSFAFFKAPLSNEEEGKRIGTLFLRRDHERPFKTNERDFLQRATEIVSLALDRLEKIEQTLERKNVWDATFNALTDPLMIVNRTYEILQTNLAFQKQSKYEAAFLPGKKCYEMLFQRTSPCPQCQLGQNFRLEFSQTFDVYGEHILLATDEGGAFVHQYHDVTEQLKMEKKIMESARLAELGTIGSSIAHELNNPLGGMLSFAQLIKLEMTKDDPLYEDISELEAGIRRCKDIVQNLLGFARDPSHEEKVKLDLRDVISRAVKIVELQSRALGIEIKLKGLDQEFLIEGYMNLLTQALQNLLQSSIQGILDEMKINKFFKGMIELQLDQTPQSVVIQILDNSPVAENSSTLSLSIARQILHEQGASLEFPVNARPFRLAKISFPRPVLQV